MHRARSKGKHRMTWFAEVRNYVRQWWAGTAPADDLLDNYWDEMTYEMSTSWDENGRPTVRPKLVSTETLRRQREERTQRIELEQLRLVEKWRPILKAEPTIVPAPAEHEGAVEGWSPKAEQAAATTGELTRIEMVPSQVTVPEQRAPIMSELEKDTHQALSGIDAATEVFRRRLDDIIHACTSTSAYRAHRGTQDTQLIPVVKIDGDRRVAHAFGTPLGSPLAVAA